MRVQASLEFPPAPNGSLKRDRSYYKTQNCFESRLRRTVPPAFSDPASPGVLGPGSINFDSLVAKNFQITEQWRAQFRWESFNTFNTPEFGLPNQALGGGGFGVVTSASSRRIMQMGLKVYW